MSASQENFLNRMILFVRISVDPPNPYFGQNPCCVSEQIFDVTMAPELLEAANVWIVAPLELATSMAGEDHRARQYS